MEKLRDHGAKRAASHDDGAFRAEGPARANRNCGRDWFEQRDFGFDAAAVDQNRFNGFRNAVAADSLRAVAGHDADDQRASDWNENAVETQMIARRRDHCSVPAAKIEDVGEQTDQTKQDERNERAERSDDHRQAGDRGDTQRGSEVSQLFFVLADFPVSF